jgi:hypothetical protein
MAGRFDRRPGEERPEDPRAQRVAVHEEAPPADREGRIVRVERTRDAWGEEQVVAVDEHGRRWYQLRPASRGRYDYLGFGAFWWVLLLLVIVWLASWGWWGWGWGWW